MNENNRILIIEDEILTGEAIKRSLAKAGYQVAGPASNADEALDVAREFHPNLAVVDIRIDGETDGIQTGRILQKEFECELIYLTAYSDQDTRNRAKQTCPATYLLKPFTVPQLLSAVEMAIQRQTVERDLKASRALVALEKNLNQKEFKNPTGKFEFRFGENLRHLLKQKQIRPSTLARTTGVPKQSISDWLAGVAPKNPMQVQKVAGCLGLTLDEIFFGHLSENERELTR